MSNRIPVWAAAIAAGFFLWLAPGTAKAEVTALHHEISVRLNPADRTLAVSDRMRVRGSGKTAFYLAPNLVITSLRKNGGSVAQNRHGDAFLVDLGKGGEQEISIDYKGLLSNLPEISGQFDTAPMMASEKGSYLSAGSAWHPIVPGIAATFKLSVSVPTPHKAVVPGRLVKETTAEGQHRAVFKSEIPAEGLVLISGAFVVNERQHDNIILRTYFPPELSELSPGYLESTAEYIDLYKDLIGQYPFSFFNIVSGPLPVGLGFPGMTYIGDRVLRLPFIRFTSLGHEVLHNWWGNGVEVDYENGNWAEGLTTYMADYAYARKRSEENAKRMRTEWLRDYAALPPRRDHAVRAFISRRHDAAQIIGYNKVAFIFHMLERQVGEIKFKQGIRKFWDRFKFDKAGWADLQNTFEAVSGQDLSTFFDQWLDRSGAPNLVLSDVFRTDSQISFTLTQPKLPYFLNVPIKLKTRDGEKMFLASIDGKASRIELTLTAPPLSIAVDPDFDIFRRLDATEAPPILRDTTLKTETLVIIQGAGADIEKTARQLASRLMDGLPRFAEASRDSLPEGPLLIIGTTPEVRQFLHQNNLPATPGKLLGKGTARVWAARRKGSGKNPQPLLVIEAKDAKAMKALLRPLPHYGRRGFLIFNGSKAVEDGIWPVEAGPLSVTFD